MIKDLEIPYGPNTLLVGDVSETNDSFDHAFGTQALEPKYEVTDFRVFEWREEKPKRGSILSFLRRILITCRLLKHEKPKACWVETTGFYRRFDPVQLGLLEAKFLYLAHVKLYRESAQKHCGG
jgi:hypothetical protein